jgi:cathepsin L
MKGSLSLVVVMLLWLLTAQVFANFSQEEYKAQFEQWVEEHGKVYNEEEVLYRFKIFQQHVDFVQKFNSEGHTYTVGLNKFADLSNSEFLEKYGGLHRPLIHVTEPEHIYQYEPSQALPTSVDWRTKGMVTPVKDQGQCGSCWSFSSTGSVEGAWAKNHSLVSLSEQNLMDCSRNYGNYGCNGGLMDNAFKYIINNRGIDTEASYPYQAYTSYTCKYNSANKGATISSYKDVSSGSEPALQNAVAYQGPVSVAIDASHSSFQLYTSGVYYEPACSSTSLDHGVLTVGYGTGTTGDYWIVKNSWGTSWGMQGYIYMARNKNNNCGIATSASFPVV